MSAVKTLELFAGSRSFSKVAESYGFETYTTDLEPFEHITEVCDIFDFDTQKLIERYGRPDVIWASPPCTAFSVASISHHWNMDKTPKTEKARYGLRMVAKTLEIIKKLVPKAYFLENPRGMLRKTAIVKSIPLLKTVTYCSYGDMRMKPTDVWTNYDFQSRPMCHNGNRECHHEPSPRGSHHSGTQSSQSAFERSRIPPALFEDIFNELFVSPNKLNLIRHNPPDGGMNG